MNRRQYAIVGSFSISLLIVALVPLSGEQGSTYNPWLDYNDDGIIDVEDLHTLGSAYGTSGTPLNQPMTLEYDSDWIDITAKRGQYFSIALGFSLEGAVWTPSVRGKPTADAPPHQKYWYGYNLPGWNKTYGGTGHDVGNSVVATNDGGYAIASTTYSYGVGNPSLYPNVYLAKTDASGNLVWNKTYGGAYADYGKSIVQTSDGGYAIAGTTSSYGSGTPAYSNVYLVKTDSSGNIVWNKTYGGIGDDQGSCLVQTSDGGYAIAGWGNSFGSGLQAYLIKTDASGNLVWNKAYGGANGDYANSLVQTSDGGYAIAGYTYSYGVGDLSLYSNVYLVMTTPSGEVSWTQTYGGMYYDAGASLAATSDGGYAIAGYTSSFDLSDPNNDDAYFIRTDASGAMLWQQTYGADYDEYGNSLVATSDGGYVIAGHTYSYGEGTPSHCNVYLVKTDALGQLDLQWGVALTDYTANTITFYRGTMDPYYNYIRVRIWVLKETP